MNRFTLKDRFRYRFDKLLARGTPVLILGLFLLSASLLGLMALAIHFAQLLPLLDGHRPSVGEIYWMALMRTLDGGTMSNDKGSWVFLLCMLLVTSAGILFVSTLTGILTSGIQRKLEAMRKGRSLVVEKDHVVMLGWSSQIFTILSELAGQEAGQCVAILADKDKVAMEDELHLKLRHLKRIDVVCRSGDPLDLQALEIVNPHEARAIIVLAPEDSPDPDSDVIKTILALTHHPQRHEEPYHIVAALQNAANLPAARMVGRGEAEFLLTRRLISRLTAQTFRQAGLSRVYHELLDCQGEDIFFCHEPRLAGKTFRQALFSYETSAVMGLRRSDGHIELNPPLQSIIEPGDKVIALSRSRRSLVLDGPGQRQIDAALLVTEPPGPKQPENFLLLDWNRHMPEVLTALDAYVATGSRLKVVAEHPRAGAEIALLAQQLRHLIPSFEPADSSARHLLERICSEDFDHVLTIADSDLLEMQQADAQTLLTLLHLRDIADAGGKQFSIVAELLDARNRELARVARVDDFVVNDRFISLMLAQLASNKELNLIYEELLDPDGCELYLKPAQDYVLPGRSVDFYTVLEAACRRGEVALGYLLASRKLCLNPSKSLCLSFGPGDKIVVLAEDG